MPKAKHSRGRVTLGVALSLGSLIVGIGCVGYALVNIEAEYVASADAYRSVRAEQLAPATRARGTLLQSIGGGFLRVAGCGSGTRSGASIDEGHSDAGIYIYTRWTGTSGCPVVLGCGHRPRWNSDRFSRRESAN